MGSLDMVTIGVRWAAYTPSGHGSDLRFLGHITKDWDGYYGEAPSGASTVSMLSKEDALEALIKIAREEGTLV